MLRALAFLNLGCQKRNVVFVQKQTLLQEQNDKALVQEGISVIVNDISPTSSQRMDIFLEELRWLRLEEAGHPNFHLVTIFEFFSANECCIDGKRWLSYVRGLGYVVDKGETSSPNPQFFAA